MSNDDTTALSQALEALRKAMLAADRTTLGELAADELVYGHTSGRTETKSQFIEGIVSGRSTFSEIIVNDQTIKVIDSVAIVHQTLDAVRSNAPGVRLKLAALSVWLRRDEQWRLLARQAVK